MRRLPALATAALLALALAGCSSPAPTDASSEAPTTSTSQDSPDTSAAAGETISGDGYSYTVPEGWGVPADTTTPAGVDTFAADLQSTGAFAANINVVLSPAGEVSLEQAEQAAPGELESVGATDVQVLDRSSVSGTDAAHLSASVATGSYLIDQYYFSHDGQTYIVTFSVADGTSEADRTAVADAVLATWQWA